MARTVSILVEIPKGSRNKYEYDEASGRIRLDRMLYSSVHYPADYGFVQQTLGGDGDPIDALVLVGEPTVPGCVIDARAVGVFRMSDDKGEDEKILAVPITDPHWNQIERLDQVPAHLLNEIDHFFRHYKDLEGKAVDIKGWEDENVADALIAEGYERALRA